MFRALSSLTFLLSVASAQWGAVAPPPSCSCGNHFKKHGTMRGFNPNPVMSKYLELDQITPIETLMELQDDRDCAKCGRMFVRIEDQISKIDSFDQYIGKMKKRRESRAQSLEKQMKQVDHEFFDVGYKPKKID